MRPITSGLPQICWYSLNETTKKVDGLAYNDFVTAGVLKSNITLELTAMNSCGLKAKTNLTLIVNDPSPHCFEVSFIFNTTETHSCDFISVDQFVSKVEQYLGYHGQNDISIIKYSRVGQTGRIFTVKIAILQSQVGCSPCNFLQISSLTKKFLRLSDNTFEEKFTRFMSPMFGVFKISTNRNGTCADIPPTSTQ